MKRHRQSTVRLVFAGVALSSALLGASQKPSDRTDPTTVPRVSLEDFRKLHAAGQVFVVDVRSEAAFNSGHIPGAMSIPLDDVERRVDEIRAKAKDRPIVTYCSCPAEHSAAEAGLRLSRQGLKNVSALAGGYTEWVFSGGSIER